MKRKEGESNFEFNQRKKKLKYQREHRYDDEKAYWKNASKNASRQNKGLIADLFAGLGASRAVSSSVGVLEAAQSAGLSAGSIGSMFGGSAEALALGEAVVGGALTGVAGGAIAAGTVGYLAGQAVESLFSQNNIESIRESFMPGTYQGKFALSKVKASQGLRDKYQKKGAVFIFEEYGRVADPDLVVLAHSSFSMQPVCTAISCAILRKVFKKGAGLDPGTLYEELPLISKVPDSGPDGFKLTFYTRNSLGLITSYDMPINNDQSLFTLMTTASGVFTLYGSIAKSLAEPNADVLVKVALYSLVSGIGRLEYQMDLEKEILSVATSSHMVVQNRTKSATASESTTQVDVQPLKGPVYEFATGVPRLKQPTPVSLNILTNNGVGLARSDLFPGSDQISYKEPLVKKAFHSVTKSAYVRLNPGALKSMTVGDDCKGYFAKVLQKMRVLTNDLSNNGVMTGCYGTSQMVIFEEEMNSGSANNITVSYECQHVAGAELTTTYSSNCQPGYLVVEGNLVPE